MNVHDRLAHALANPAGLRELDLRGRSGDRLAALPDAIGRLKDLEVLRLEGNELEALPSAVDKLRNLRELHLAHNRLTSEGIPRGLWFLSKLEVLNLHGNRVAWVDNLGNYQRTQRFELYVGGNPLDPARYLVAGRAVHPLWHHVLHMFPLTRYGRFRLRTLALDLSAVRFPLPGPQLHHEPPFEQVERLVLYGTPTAEQLAELSRTFPAARIEHFPDATGGPHLSHEPAASPPPAAPQVPASPRPWHPQQLAALVTLRTAGAKRNDPLDEPQVRACIAVTSRKPKKVDLRVGASRLGGVPDLPAGTAWPRGDGGAPMEFVAQLRLEDLAPFDPDGLLPSSGLLSFFVGGIEDGRVLYASDVDALRPASFPTDATFAGRTRGEPYPAAALAFEGDVTAADGADGAVRDPAWRRRRKKALHRVLGHEFGDTYGQFEEDHVLLLALGSDEQCHMQWGDVGRVYFAIRRDDLARREWTKVEVFTSA